MLTATFHARRFNSFWLAGQSMAGRTPAPHCSPFGVSVFNAASRPLLHQVFGGKFARSLQRDFAQWSEAEVPSAACHCEAHCPPFTSRWIDLEKEAAAITMPPRAFDVLEGSGGETMESTLVFGGHADDCFKRDSK